MEEKKPEHNFQRGDFVTNGSATIIVIGRQGRDKTLFAGVIVQQNDPTDKVHKVGEYSESWHGWKFKKIEYCHPRAVWVKASTRLPQSHEALYIKIEKGKSIGSWHPHHEMFVDDAGDFHPADQVEWLDELGTAAADNKPEPKWVKDALQWVKETIDFAWDYVKVPESLVETWGNMYMNTMHAIQEAQQEIESPAAGREEDAVAFAEWIREEAYQNAIGIWNNGFQRCEGGKEFTSAQLYELFKQQKEK